MLKNDSAAMGDKPATFCDCAASLARAIVQEGDASQ